MIKAVGWLYCGPPMETDAGWLVLTDGVGPMRTYRIGAIRLDLDNPTRILGQLRQQLLIPLPTSRTATCQCLLLVRRACARGDYGAHVRHR